MPQIRSQHFNTALGAGLSLAAVAAPAIGLLASDFGWRGVRLAALGLGLVTLAVGRFDRRGRVSNIVTNCWLVPLAVYFTLLAVEAGLTVMSTTVKNPHLGLQGMYTRDERLGYRLTPNWRGQYDDGLAAGEYRINSRGQRDGELVSNSSRRVLLLGDSMTFGELLDQTATIDAQIESLSGGKIDAYNLGVLAYGPPAILETFRGAEGIAATHVFYQFFNNDLRNDNLRLDNGLTERRGYAVPKFRPDGSLYSLAELDAEIDRITSSKEVSFAQQCIRAIKLRETRKRASLFIRAIGGTWNPAALGHVDRGEANLLGGPPEDYDDGNVLRAVAVTAQMAELAFHRQMQFYVVIVPSIGETGVGRYSKLTTEYIEQLRHQRMQVVEPRDRLTVDDYFPHNQHLNAHGARKVAELISEVIATATPP